MNKSFRKFFTVALASGMVVSSNIPTLSYALQPKETPSASEFQADAKLTPVAIKSNVDTKTEEMVSIIVELKEAPLAVAKYNQSTYSSKTQDKIEKQQQDFIAFAKKLESEKNIHNTKVEFGATYKTVFNGMAMKLPGKDVEKLLESGLVKTIYKNDTVQLELPSENQTKSQNSEIAPLMHDSLTTMNVAKLHEQGIKGEGMKIGVLDTGIDFNHPDLKDNYKGGWDCVDEDDKPMEATYDEWKKLNAENPDMYPEFNPFTQSSYYTSHGTHVSGTVAANGKNTESDFAVTGVAPEAELYGYRVLGPYGSGSTEDIMQGIERAVNDKMDVINLSLGASGADPLNPMSIACDNAMLAGTTTIIANGNAGPGLSTAGTPAASKLSISVGASTTAITLDKFDITLGDLKVDSNTLSRRFDSNISDLENKDLEIVDCGIGQTSDFEGKDLKGKVALIQRGELSFHDKLMNAKKAGCSVALIYNNEDGDIPFYLGESNEYVSSLALSKAEGESIKAALEGVEKPTISIKANGKSTTQKDLLSDFSSRGPIPGTVDIKPDLVAPGEAIFSTYPEFINHKDEGEDYSSAYSRISGTSMASPHVAGLAALIESQNPDYDSFDTKVALMNTSDKLAKDYGVNEVGAGRANALEAVESKISIRAKGQAPTVLPDGEIGSVEYESGSLAFGKVSLEDGNAVAKNDLIIENNSGQTNSFDVSVEYTEPTKENGAMDAKKNNVKVEVKERALASKNAPTKLGVTITIPKSAEHGVYQGYINIKSTRNENENYRIPFSVQAVQPGIGTFEFFNPGMTNDVNSIMMSDGVIGIDSIISLNSPMEKLHILVRDSKTDEVVGYAGTLNAQGVPTDIELYTGYILNQHSTVYAVENGKLQNYTKDLKEGLYKMELMGVSPKGNSYSAYHPFVVDNNPLDISFSLNGVDLSSKSQIIEMKEELFTTQEGNNGQTHTAVWLDGMAYDSSIDDLKSAGVTEYRLIGKKADQGLNSIRYYVNGSPYIGGEFKVNPKGDFKLGVTAEDVSVNGYEKLRLEGLDASFVRDLRLDSTELIFVEEGRAYIEASYNKEMLKMDEQAKLNLKFNNLKDVKTIETSIKVYNDVEAKNIKLNGDYNKNFKLTTKETIVEEDKFNPPHKLIDIKVEPKKNALLNGNVDLIQIGVELKNNQDNIYDITPILIDKVDIYSENTTKQECLNLLNPTIKKDAKSEIIGSATSMALIYSHDNPLNPDTHKVDIYATDSSGKKYESTLSSGAYQSGRMNYSIKGFDVTDEYVDLTIDLPGHFPISNKIAMGKLMNDELFAKTGTTIIDHQSIPGDVNSDNVIDIKDAKAIADVFNKEGNNFGEIDLNQDGKIDDKDMYFVVLNFGMENPEKPGNKPQGSEKELNELLEKISYEDPGFDLN